MQIISKLMSSLSELRETMKQIKYTKRPSSLKTESHIPLFSHFIGVDTHWSSPKATKWSEDDNLLLLILLWLLIQQGYKVYENPNFFFSEEIGLS